MEITYIHEPTDLQCGQAVIAMAAGVTVADVIALLGNDRETDLSEMKRAFSHFGYVISPQRSAVTRREELPRMALLSLETPRCWHWSLYCEGVFYDPEHGVMDDFPESARRYCWELRAES